MAFDTQLQDLIGTFSDQTAMDQFMTDGAKEVISVMPLNLLEQCSDISTLNNSTTTLTNIDTKVRVLKSRYTGDTGLACSLRYNNETGRLFEVTEEETFDNEDF